MSKGTLILLLWLMIGAAAAAQRGYFSSSATLGCSQGATIALTIVAGPVNYVGLNPQISCAVPSLPKPSGA